MELSKISQNHQTKFTFMNTADFSTLLLDWYKHHGRSLPWRVKGGAHPNPYVILVSEFMLQQTTVKTVIPYFHRFMERFPDIQALAAAELEEVYQLWQGLGYYTRARSLHETAKIIMNKFDGKFPDTKEDVLKLKGIGEYTVASFLSLAFNQPQTVIDGNVIRIICRLFHLTEPTEKIMPQIREKAAAICDKNHAADYASAIMDLGAGICTPKKPQCLLCPWQQFCQSKNLPDLEKIPNRTKPAKKEKHGFVHLIFNSQNEIFIRKRTEKGLLSGLYEFPWAEKKLYPQAKENGQQISHVFTHFKLTLKICTCHMETPPTDGKFISPNEFEKYPFSTLMKKAFTRYNGS